MVNKSKDPKVNILFLDVGPGNCHNYGSRD